METQAGKRPLQHQPDESQAHPRKRAKSRATLHRDGDHPEEDPAPLEGSDHEPARRPPSPGPLQQQRPQPKKSRGLLDPIALGHVTELWERLQVLHESLKKMPFSEGLKPLKCFSSLQELLSLGGDNLLHDLVSENKKIRETLNSAAPFLTDAGTCKSLNYNTQPVIGVIYGPTGSGKSQLLRNLMSAHLITPAPETVFFIAPQVDMIPPQEIMSWETQICEGNYQPGPDDTIVPQSGTLMPKFVKMSYDELLQDYNYDVTHPQNVFAQAASKGPIAIIMDECMEELGRHKGVAKFFHAFPSKLHDKFPKCTGYCVMVVLHNMNPRKDQGGNISNLKIQAKLHLISPRMQPTQLTRFVNTYTKGLPLAISLLLKDIFNYYSQNSHYDWIIYNTCPENDSMQWMYLHPQEGLMPMYLNVQTLLYQILEKIHRIITDRQRWTRYYHAKRK
ncbi:IVa2 [Bat mastadenovirus WIV11]|uniref:Packaging protein 1 n=2 Tax=Bat mastadenovirus C TaxID=2015370 RepID=A0A161DIA2_9ADEN|nr:IVa2 [Bat mastadenovirus WIV9]YP_009246418.1 IVa2 [Bat mastadenovirus WIV11]AMB43048.1 IVa2 [Bat mastadenovirus WIV9]AMB43114.1 IVa2 [Bat mastadenovirus WIV11]